MAKINETIACFLCPTIQSWWKPRLCFKVSLRLEQGVDASVLRCAKDLSSVGRVERVEMVERVKVYPFKNSINTRYTYNIYMYNHYIYTSYFRINSICSLLFCCFVQHFSNAGDQTHRARVTLRRTFLWACKLVQLVVGKRCVSSVLHFILLIINMVMYRHISYIYN